jgi:YggT family protein
VGPFIAPFINAVLIILDVIQWIVFAWVILSWIVFFTRQSSFRWRYKQAYGVLEQLDEILSRMTSPFLRPFRRLLPPHNTAGIDWSPMLLLLAIFILRGLIAAAAGAILFGR